MIGWLRKLPASGRDGAKSGSARAHHAARHRAEAARSTADGDFAARHSLIWNDIQRALEGARK